MRATLIRHHRIESAHYLPRTHVNHRCHRMHGHTFRVTLEYEGLIDPAMGWVIDFGKLDQLWSGQVHAAIDHRCLNEIEGLENPTSENLARWIWKRLTLAQGKLSQSEWPEGCHLVRVVVWENEDCGAVIAIDGV